MDELIAWLRAQLDEDALVAQRVKSETEGAWAWTYRNVHAIDTATGKTQPIATTDTGAQAVYFGLWNPDRALAEVKAKRRILDAVLPQVVSLEDTIHGEFSAYPEVDVPDLLLKTLAQPYAGLSGWRQEWLL